MGFEEAFVFFLRNPQTAKVHFEVRTDGEAGWGVKEKDGSRCVGEGVDYHVAQLLQHPRNTDKVNLKLHVWEASVTSKVQLRVLDAHEPEAITKKVPNIWTRFRSTSKTA